MSRIFVSYASGDHARVQRVVAGMEHQALACWMAPRDIPAGDDYQTACYEGIKGCDVLLLLVSSRSNGSQDVARELAVARDLGKPIVPARIEDVKPEAALGYQVSSAQWIDLFRDFDDNLARLCRDVGRMLLLSEEVARRQKRQKTRRRVGRVAVSVTAVALVCAGAWLVTTLGPPVTVPGSATPLQAGSESLVAATAAGAGSGAVADEALKRFARDFYSKMSGPRDRALNYLAGVTDRECRLNGKLMPEALVVETERQFIDKWPQRSFAPRPDTIRTRCDDAGTDCTVTGSNDFEVHNPATNVAHWGVEQFTLALLHLGDTIKVTGISTIVAERHVGLASRRDPLPVSAQ